MLHYDVVVIGSGPAGENGAIQAAFTGKKVALIEKEAVPGGASANTGTIPSKALRETALAILQARSRDAHGIELRISGTVTIPELMGRKGLVTAREHSRIRDALNRAGVEQFRGIASFVDPHTIRVSIPDGGAQELQADIILLAPGTRPFHPPQYPIDNAHVYDSDSILLLDRVPRSLAVLGGGVAGCEYASLFGALGVNVKLVDSKDRLLTWLDAEMSHALEDVFRSSGIDLHQRNRAARLDPGDKDVLVTLEDGGRMVAQKVLVASGRVGNVEALNLPAAGLEATERGLLKVNAQFQTAVPHIYAAGDVVGFPGLASVSMEQGRVAMSHACGGILKQRVSSILPMGIYTIPEVSSVGDTEETLKEQGRAYVVGRASLTENARANLIGEAVGFLKIIADAENGRILGVHCIGPHASELVHTGAAVMAHQGDLQYFIEAVFNYPTLGEAYKYAAYDALDRMRERREGNVWPFERPTSRSRVP
ncbi:Si-specific NAD(P)(+) transhydrogenase [Anaeromyxobacter sp. Fw109-5]|uniref:Si-specific NAD(P)(+) transhydrogenase n=1 Tax=Anaeromyxobacter sp. (strain Fw109-5) TaxID=404589 RepID=UPI0000ED6D85|nr:Si-specific NAD(P)(+) transhydrogenase [Anaeromyxobacter sp. Fw109-5]ABS28123.1 pyridine nucleotide-disulphide oxidoreductase dimerisation region [Anaeromyxobacter sp. Fw109-5]